MTEPVVTTIKAHGRSYRINNPGSGRVGSHLSRGVPYEPELLEDVHARSYAGVAFDIGASVGNHTLYLAAVCGLSVHAWEPNQAAREQLAANIALNPGLDITVHDWACGDRHTRARFSSGMSLKTERGNIAVHPIDEMVDVPGLAVVKVDVEGMEPEALAGMTSHLERDHPDLYVESHTHRARESVRAVVAPLGYDLAGVFHMGSRMDMWAVL